MSPEQARGATADHRSDILSFGSVLYEMLTGERAFHRETAAETLTAILKEEPKELASLTASLPPALDRILRHCLEKDPSARVQSARDLAFDIELIAGLTSTGAEKLAPRSRLFEGARTRTLWLGAGLLLGTVATVVALRVGGLTGSHGARAVAHLSVNLPQGSRLAPSLYAPLVAISPDGQQLVCSAFRADGTRQLYLRALSEPQARLIPGTEGGDMPFFSPDGRWLGFMVSGAGKLRRVPIDGAAPRDLAEAGEAYGASWFEDGLIVYAPDPTTHPLLMGVNAESGTPRALTTLGTSEVNHRWPQLLPGGRAVLFTAELAGKPFDDAIIVAQNLETGERNVVVEAGSHGRYVSTGHIVYGRGNALHAVPFDLKRRRATGPSQVVLEGVRVDTPTGGAQFDVSVSGTLVYLPRGAGTAERALIWVDRFGNTVPVTEAGGLYNTARLSPDGRRIAAEVAAAENNIWMIDLATGSHTRLTFESENNLPVWMPDGRSILFSSARGGASRNLYRLFLDGSAAVQRLTESPDAQFPEAISPDGRLLVFTEAKPDGDTDLAVLSLTGEPKARPLIQTQFIEKHAQLSPDGRHLAYVSNESGSFEVYVQAFPSLGAKVRVSIDGGAFPIWSRDGREIYFRNGEQIMAARVSPGEVLSVARPKALFSGSFAGDWEAAPDGRFLMIRRSEEETSSREINVVLNWFEELKQRVPSGAR